jgi:hypothetical protein
MAELSAHAKEAEGDAAAARTEERAKVQVRIDKLQADASARRAQVDASAAAAKDAVTGRWTAMHTQVKTGIDGIKADIDAKKREADKGRAERKADHAEDNAAAAIAFAYDAIDYAESAVLDAVIARSDADSLRGGEPASIGKPISTSPPGFAERPRPRVASDTTARARPPRAAEGGCGALM